MLVIIMIVMDVVFFTFQSGSIQIYISMSAADIYSSLHSNLVLFKLQEVLFLYSFLRTLHSNLVLFK